MKILLLSPYPQKIRGVLEDGDNEIIIVEEVLNDEFLRAQKFDLGISYGYRHIIKVPVLALFPIINLHISYLPWNRGADPNVWSWIEDTPKGVSVHYVDEGIDTGDIIAQRLVAMQTGETLSTSYERLHREMIGLFSEIWPAIKSGTAARSRQSKGGSYHGLKDRKRFEPLLTAGYDTPAGHLRLQKR